MFIEVPCGKCGMCLQKKRRSWTFRLMAELRFSWSAFFVTLTYNDESLVDLNKRDIQLFMKRLRKEEEINRSEHLDKRRIKYYIVGEYGSLGRPHYHGLIFNLSKKTIDKLESIWSNGFVKVGTISEASIMYVLKYMMDPENKFRPLISKGIGIDYLEKNEKRLKNKPTKVTYLAGKRNTIPRYYTDKIYNDDEKRQLRVENSRRLIKTWKKKYEDLEKHHKDPYELRRQELEQKSKKIIIDSQKNRKL